MRVSVSQASKQTILTTFPAWRASLNQHVRVFEEPNSGEVEGGPPPDGVVEDVSIDLDNTVVKLGVLRQGNCDGLPVSAAPIGSSPGVEVQVAFVVLDSASGDVLLSSAQLPTAHRMDDHGDVVAFFDSADQRSDDAGTYFQQVIRFEVGGLRMPSGLQEAVRGMKVGELAVFSVSHDKAHRMPTTTANSATRGSAGPQPPSVLPLDDDMTSCVPFDGPAPAGAYAVGTDGAAEESGGGGGGAGGVVNVAATPEPAATQFVTYMVGLASWSNSAALLAPVATAAGRGGGEKRGGGGGGVGGGGGRGGDDATMVRCYLTPLVHGIPPAPTPAPAPAPAPARARAPPAPASVLVQHSDGGDDGGGGHTEANPPPNSAVVAADRTAPPPAVPPPTMTAMAEETRALGRLQHLDRVRVKMWAAFAEEEEDSVGDDAAHDDDNDSDNVDDRQAEQAQRQRSTQQRRARARECSPCLRFSRLLEQRIDLDRHCLLYTSPSPRDRG